MTIDVFSHVRCDNGRLAAINDEFRRRGWGNGDVVLTKGIRDRGEIFVTEVRAAVQAYDDFTPENDPAGDHGFGSLDVIDHDRCERVRICFKYDYYDDDMIFGSSDPTDESRTHRVLTVFEPLEY